MSRWTGVAVAAALAVCGAPVLHAQDGSSEADARSRELSERMRVTLRDQARALSQMQRELTRAAGADMRVRDSIVRVTSQRISELAAQIAQVQMEADRLQAASADLQIRSDLRAQLASARAMGNLTRALAGQQRALTFMSTAAPRGYLGVTLSGAQNTEVRDGKVVTLYESPLSIESVVPDSPAARSGLQAGDTIVAFGKLAVPGAVPLNDVLRPGERVPIRIRRSGRERTVTVVVDTLRGVRVNMPSIAFTSDTIRICSDDERCTTVAASVNARGAATVTATAPAAPRSPVAPMAPPVARAPVPPRAPAVVSGFSLSPAWSATDLTIAGAVMTTITDELEELTGVDEGVLVLRVAPGTPAASSGLRGGDVILSINGEDCEGVRDVQRAVQRASTRGDRSVPLVVRRQRKETSLTLRW